jgi:hypothetical protein
MMTGEQSQALADARALEERCRAFAFAARDKAEEAAGHYQGALRLLDQAEALVKRLEVVS